MPPPPPRLPKHQPAGTLHLPDALTHAHSPRACLPGAAAWPPEHVPAASCLWPPFTNHTSQPCTNTSARSAPCLAPSFSSALVQARCCPEWRTISSDAGSSRSLLHAVAARRSCWARVRVPRAALTQRPALCASCLTASGLLPQPCRHRAAASGHGSAATARSAASARSPACTPPHSAPTTALCACPLCLPTKISPTLPATYSPHSAFPSACFSAPQPRCHNSSPVFRPCLPTNPPNKLRVSLMLHAAPTS